MHWRRAGGNRVKKLVVGLSIGALLGTLVGALLPWGEKYDTGRCHGKLDGLGEALGAVRAEFGEVDSSAASKALFHCKTSSAVVVVVDGVKTIRAVP